MCGECHTPPMTSSFSMYVLQEASPLYVVACVLCGTTRDKHHRVDKGGHSLKEKHSLRKLW